MKKKRYDLKKGSLRAASSIDTDMLINRKYEGITFEEDILGCSFDNCEFINCVFKGKMKNTTFFNVRFYKCELSNIMLLNNGIHYCLFENCHMVGVNYLHTKIKNSEFKNSQMKISQFSGVQFVNLDFNDCNFNDNNINDCIFEEAIEFNNCNMAELEVHNSRLNEVDVSSSNIEGLKTDVKNVQGMKVSEVQAIGLIDLLGIVIK